MWPFDDENLSPSGSKYGGEEGTGSQKGMKRELTEEQRRNRRNRMNEADPFYGYMSYEGAEWTTDPKFSQYERDYLYDLHAKSRGLGEQSFAQKQLARNIQAIAGAQYGIAASQRGRSFGRSYGVAEQRAAQARTEGQEASGFLGEAERQEAKDALRSHILGGVASQRNIDANQAANRDQRKWGMIGSGLSAAAAIAAAVIASGSDKRIKSNISEKKGEKKIRDMLDGMKAYNYDLLGKNETGPMAQDFENSEAGREMIRRGPAGIRMIDQPQAIKKMLAAFAIMKKDNDSLKSRLDKMDKKKAG